MVANCEQVWREISNYLEGEVDAPLRATMDEHFATCARCKSLLEGARSVIRLYSDERMIDERTLGEGMIDVPAGFGRQLERKLAESSRIRSRGWSTWSAWLVPVAALILIAGGFRVANSLTVPRPLQSEHAQPGNGIPGDMVVVVSTDAKEFHVPGCPFIHNKDRERTLTAKEAMQEGYVPCVRCMRKYLQIADVERMSLELEADAYARAGD